jgi:hypothetical protein
MNKKQAPNTVIQPLLEGLLCRLFDGHCPKFLASFFLTKAFKMLDDKILFLFVKFFKDCPNSNNFNKTRQERFDG